MVRRDWSETIGTDSKFRKYRRVVRATAPALVIWRPSLGKSEGAGEKVSETTGIGGCGPFQRLGDGVEENITVGYGPSPPECDSPLQPVLTISN